MVSPPPQARQSQHLRSAPSPQQSIIFDMLSEDRNSEARHRALIEQSRLEHERVRNEAERVYEEYCQTELRRRLLQEKRAEEDRIRREEQIARDRQEVIALKKKVVEIPLLPKSPALPPNPNPQHQQAASGGPKPAPGAGVGRGQVQGQGQDLMSQVNGTAAKVATTGAAQPPSTISHALASHSGQIPPAGSPSAIAPATTKPNPFANGILGHQPPPGAQPSPAPASTSASSARPPQPPAVPKEQTILRYVEIHKNLKALRKSMVDQASSNRALKSRMGDMRREIRKATGQLTGAGLAGNRAQVQKLEAILREALSNQLQSQLVDPAIFVLSPRPPAQGAAHNAQLPSIFIYLLNILSKAATSQFINEAGPRPETANPVGVCLVSVFSDPIFLWRGASLIDILMAKLCVSCPVLFGAKGSERTEQGRARLGWIKNGGKWVSEQEHMDRMTGLGAGFAAIALRNFRGSRKAAAAANANPNVPPPKANPYPPRHYWAAMARIVDTPPAEVSDTQCVVLKAMIQNFELNFLTAYGHAARAALRLSLLEFPQRIGTQSAAVGALRVHAHTLKKDLGLDLEKV